MAALTTRKETIVYAQRATLDFAAKEVNHISQAYPIITSRCLPESSAICGAILLTPTGKIVYHEGSDRANVPGTGKCTWRVSTDPKRRIALGAVSFDPTAFDCQGSYLAVHDGEDSTAPLIGMFCKTRPFETIFSSSRHIYIEYTAPKVGLLELHYVTFYAGTRDS